MIIRWFDPDSWWDFIEPKLDQRHVLPMLLGVALVGGFGIALATEIGVRIFNTDWNYVAGYGMQRDRGGAPFLALWGIAAGAPLMQGLVGAHLLKFYSRPRQWLRSIAVAVVGTIPVYVAGLTLVVLPGILVVVIAFLVSCAWWSSGSRRLLGIVYGDSAEHVAGTLVLSGALLVLVSASVPI